MLLKLKMAKLLMNNWKPTEKYSSKALNKNKEPKKERWFDRFLFWVKPEENFEGFEFKFTWKF